MNSNTMSNKQAIPSKGLLRTNVRFCISSAVSLGLATVILWGLISNSEPKATLNNFYLKPVNENYSTLTFEMHFINNNYFRGFNFTNGWIEFFYVRSDKFWSITYQWIPEEYHGFRNSTAWNDTINVTSYYLEWPRHTDPLRTRENYIYVSLYLSYWYKILFWTTSTTYYQWLDTSFYLNNNLTYKEPNNFNRMKNFTMGIST